MATNTKSGRGWGIFLAVLLLAGGGMAVVALNRGNEGDSSAKPAGVAGGPAQVSEQDRAAAYMKATEAGTKMSAEWPKTEKELVIAFWEAASRKDFDRLVVYCPGATIADFKNNYDQWTPSPANSVGEPERHPTNPRVTLFPAQVPFPGFPNKTIKMAVYRLPDGRPAIDGANTIWW